jgi:hypothetical protein
MIFRAWAIRSGPKSTEVRTTRQTVNVGMTSSLFGSGWRKYSLRSLSRSGRYCPVQNKNPARPNHVDFMACDYNIEITIKELKGGLHLGQMQVTRDADRVSRSVALSVCAYLLLVRLYGRDEALEEPWSLFRLKQRFSIDVMRDQIDRTERKWQRKIKQYQDAA